MRQNIPTPRPILCYNGEVIMGKATKSANHAFISKIRVAGITAEDIISLFDNLKKK